MSQRYKNLDLENYLLTIMNMVASVYKDSSFEGIVNIVVVKIIILQDEVILLLFITVILPKSPSPELMAIIETFDI